MMMFFWSLSLLASFSTDGSGTTSSSVPCRIRPEDGQGARNEKSYMLAGGAMETKPSISGRRIRSCMPIQAPKEKPATQQDEALALTDCNQSSAEAASDSSPWPLSKSPCERPTPRKLKRTTEKPF